MSQDFEEKVQDDSEKTITPEPTVQEGKYKCEFCEFTTDDPLEKGRHSNSSHKEELKKKREQKDREQLRKLKHKLGEESPEPSSQESTSEEQIPQAPAKNEDDIRSDIAIRGRTALNELKFDRLKEVMSKAPRVSNKAREWVEWKWTSDESIHDDPYRLHHTITGAGVDDSIAVEIVNAVWSIENKYADVLRHYNLPYYPFQQTGQGYPQRTYQGFGGGPYSPYPNSNLLPGQFQNQPYGQPGYPQDPRYSQDPRYPGYPSHNYGMPGGYPAPSITKSDVDLAVKTAIDSLKDQLKGSKEEKVKIPIPVIGPDGEVLRNENGDPWIQVSEVPVSLAPMYLNMARGSAKNKEGLISPEIQEQLNTAAENTKAANDRAAALQKQIEDKEKQELKDLVIGTREEIKKVSEEAKRIASSKTIEGYNSDSYRFLGQGMDKGAEVLEKIANKNTVIEGIKLLTGGGTNTPVNTQTETVVDSAMEEEFKRKGILK